MSAGWRRARPRETFVEHLQRRHLRKDRPTPPNGSPGPALAADLIEEKARHAVDEAVVMRLGDPRASVEHERDQALVGDGSSQELVDSAGGQTHDRSTIAKRNFAGDPP